MFTHIHTHKSIKYKYVTNYRRNFCCFNKDKHHYYTKPFITFNTHTNTHTLQDTAPQPKNRGLDIIGQVCLCLQWGPECSSDNLSCILLSFTQTRRKNHVKPEPPITQQADLLPNVYTSSGIEHTDFDKYLHIQYSTSFFLFSTLLLFMFSLCASDTHKNY